jgi:alanyl-tRNA synthetase
VTPTSRIYLHDASVLAFEASVVAHATFPGADARPSVVLDTSAFYPESGGQLADRGTLAWPSLGDTARGRASVLDVQLDDDGLVHHLVADGEPLPPVGVAIQGRVDRARRRAHTALHTAQHMLSRALLDEARAATVSARLGETACTIDLDTSSLAEADVARAEALVNDVIDDDRPIRAFFPTPAELAALPLRRAPKVTENIRVVDIDGFDVSPCGGTHAARTSGVALLKITSLEREKGKMRVTFTAGPRARAELGRAFDTTTRLARELTCGPLDVPVALDKLRQSLADERAASKRHVAELAAMRADAVLASLAPDRAAVLELPGASVELLRQLAGRITETGRVAILAGGGAPNRSLVVSSPEGHATDAGALLRSIATKAGGRGGGRKNHAEGTLPAGVPLEALVQS